MSETIATPDAYRRALCSYHLGQIVGDLGRLDIPMCEALQADPACGYHGIIQDLLNIRARIFGAAPAAQAQAEPDTSLPAVAAHFPATRATAGEAFPAHSIQTPS